MSLILLVGEETHAAERGVERIGTEHRLMLQALAEVVNLKNQSLVRISSVAATAPLMGLLTGSLRSDVARPIARS